MPTSINYYTVTIDNSITTATPSDGFVDNTTLELYYSNTDTPYPFETTPVDLTFDLALAKRRGNIRYQEIIRQIELVQNIWIDPKTIVATGGIATAEPSAITFQMVAFMGQGAFVTHDELNPGMVLMGTDCVQRCVARALCNAMFREADVFDPTSAKSVPSTTTDVPRFGTRVIPAYSLLTNAFSTAFEVGPYATTLSDAAATVSVVLLF